MLMGNEFDHFFAQIVRTLSPYLDEVLCIGGCANALYRFHDLASPMPWGYLGTKDVDVATPLHLTVKGGKSVAVLMAEAGLEEEQRGSGQQAVIKYRPKSLDLAADLEFLCPLSGVRGQREGLALPSVCMVQEGLHAQPLRYLEILFSRPWSVKIGKIPEFRDLGGLCVNVPNPAAYIVQKILIRDQRRADLSKAKDCYYIYEISVVFRDALDQISSEFNALSPFLPSWKNRFQKEVVRLFESENAEGPTLAVQAYQDAGRPRAGTEPPPTPEMVYRSVNKLLDAMCVFRSNRPPIPILAGH
jgi:hypothetical protein